MKEIGFNDGKQIYRIGDRADYIYSVVSGFVIVRRPDPGGAYREQLMGPGAVFGAAEVLAGTLRTSSAQTHGAAVVMAHLPASVVNTMIDQPETADAMVATLLRTFTRGEKAAEEELPMIGPNAVQLIPREQALIEQMGEEPLMIDRFPFFIGRKSDNKDPYIDGPIDGPAALILRDSHPFRLSRRHFSIDQEDGRFVVYDHRSFHGTIVNGNVLGPGGGELKSQLEPGENEIIAGDAQSPFRFTCMVPTIPGG